MAITSYAQLTLVELAKRIDPQGDLQVIAEVLAKDNEFLLDAIFQEANDTFSHKHVRRASLPTGSWRKLNEGVGTEASQTIQIVENIGMLEVYSEVDKKLVDTAPNPAQFRMDEAAAFLEGLSQTWATTFVYGDVAADPEKFDGLAARMNALAASANVIGEGGSGSDLSSIYIVQWGPTKVFMTYPRNSKMGINHEDLGEVTLKDGNDKQYQGYRDHFVVDSGLVVRDPRCIARLANIDTVTGTNTFDEDNLLKLLNRMPNRGKGAVIYCNEEIHTQMEIKLKDKTNVNYTPGGGEGLAGEPIVRFRGSPIRQMDCILNSETVLT